MASIFLQHICIAQPSLDFWSCLLNFQEEITLCETTVNRLCYVPIWGLYCFPVRSSPLFDSGGTTLILSIWQILIGSFTSYRFLGMLSPDLACRSLSASSFCLFHCHLGNDSSEFSNQWWHPMHMNLWWPAQARSMTQMMGRGCLKP